jgi:SOS-response transcriptional repressor LexA
MIDLAEQAGIEIPDNSRVDLKGFHKIPFMTDVSCGDGIDIEDLLDDLNTFTTAPDSMVSKPEKTFAFRAEGDSMIPDISSGDVVIIEHSSELSTSRIHLINLDGKMLLGRVHRTQNGYEIEKSNRNFSSIPVRHNQKFKICGFMTGVINYKNYN